MFKRFKFWGKGKEEKSGGGVKSSPTYTLDDLNRILTGVQSGHDALGVEAFFSCLQDQAGTIGSLPLRLYRKGVLDERPERVEQGLSFKVLTERPCSFMSMQEFLEFAVYSYRSNGAFHAYPVRNEKGVLTELIPFFNQANVRPAADTQGNVYYTYVTNDGRPWGPVPVDQLFVVRGMTTDGYTPIRPLTYQSQLIKMAKNQDENYSNLQSNGITSQMALSTDGLFDNKEARNRLKEDFEKFRGPGGHKEIPIFEQGLKPVSLKLTPQEMDLLKNREFSVKRICAMTETMPHRIGAETIKATDKIFELDEAQFKKWNPFLVKIENELSRIAGRYLTVKFNRKAFYAGSPFRLVESLEREYKSGGSSLAEYREDLGRDFITGTEDIFVIKQNNCTFGPLSDMQAVNRIEDEVPNGNPTQE